MEKRNLRKAQPEIMWKIRNNSRKGNFSKVAELVMEVLRREESDETKHDLIKNIYGDYIVPCIERTDNGEQIPKQYENMLLEYAKYEQSQEKLEQAIKEEQEASALAEQAVNAEKEASMRKKEFEERQKKIADERAAIQKKLDEFIEL